MQKVAIIGLGYVGLPLLCLTREKGYISLGFDIDESKLELIKKRKSPIQDESVISFLKKSSLELNVTNNPEDLKGTDIIIICVPTPVFNDFSPNLEPLKSASKTVLKALSKNQLVIVESTIYPGTTEEIVKPILEGSGLVTGEDYYLAHCPERIDPGNTIWTLRNIPRVCGAFTLKGLELTVNFYQSILDAKIHPLPTLRSAEACKVVENSFRDINIAFVNELAMSFDKMGIDILDVLEGAATKPFAFLPHYPGTGVGGHCIPVDPYYLIKKATDIGFNHEFLKAARKVNNFMPYYTIELLNEVLEESSCSPQNQTIGLMGISFKKGIDDIRNSPYITIKRELDKKGVKVLSFDPKVKEESSVGSMKELLIKSDFIILITDHEEFKSINPQEFADNHVIGIVDGRNVLPKEKIKELGIIYRGIGRR